MILYLDTSALVKLYAPETESEAVKRRLERAEVAATSCLAYVEARAAFARKRRERGMSFSCFDARLSRALGAKACRSRLRLSFFFRY